LVYPFSCNISSPSFMEEEDLENEIVLPSEIYFANEKRK